MVSNTLGSKVDGGTLQITNVGEEWELGVSIACGAALFEVECDQLVNTLQFQACADSGCFENTGTLFTTAVTDSDDYHLCKSSPSFPLTSNIENAWDEDEEEETSDDDDEEEEDDEFASEDEDEFEEFDDDDDEDEFGDVEEDE